MCNVHNQWYDISCATLYKVNKHCVASYDIVMFCQELHSSCSLSSFQLAKSVHEM